jgi:hypothetical protein
LVGFLVRQFCDDASEGGEVFQGVTGGGEVCGVCFAKGVYAGEHFIAAVFTVIHGK